ncbi:MAG: isocitrate lyase/phosphoenolpyruvate mutase family protein, partial [Desulfurococcales archaeon]|nr:isocitrate lyase/phosphoenolpyruvate mutase family protein [Desulfurococcales archaeon]
VYKRQVKKVIAAKRAAGDELLIVARTDARGVLGLDEAIERAKAYIKAGADIIFPEALRSEEEFKEVAKKLSGVPLLANMTEFGVTPYYSVDDFRRWGYKLVIFPVTLLRYSLGAMRQALQVLKLEGTQKNLLNGMMTRKEFYELINYTSYEEEDRQIIKEYERLFKKG